MPTEGNKKIRMYLEGIQPAAWEHPADRAALKALQQVPGLDTVIKAVFGVTSEKSLRLMTLASAVRVTPKQFAHIHDLHLEACKILDVKDVPDLFIAQNPFLNAGAIGVDHPFITLNSSLLDSMDDEEILGIIGHELAHIQSGHVLYKSLLVLLINLSQLALNIPLTGFALLGVIAALREWDRKSELSADRAGLLAMQDPEKAIHLQMKMAGGRHLDKMDLGEFVKQAEEYKNANTISDTAHKVMNTLWLSHPYSVIRASELMEWVRSGDYDHIIRGFYRDKQGSAFTDDVKQAASEYGKDIKETIDPILKQVGDAGKKAKTFFDDILKK